MRAIASRHPFVPWMLVLALLVAGGLAWRIDGYPLLDPDEGRNAEVAREMAESNDYLLPRLNGLPYLDKPVLYFAAAAAMMEILGPSELAARLPSLLFTIGTLGLLVWFGNRLFGAPAGWLAAIATASMPLTLAFSRTVIFDSAVTFFVVAALIGFYFAIETPTVKGWPGAVAWAALGLGILTKGPIALALPLMIVVPYAAWRRRLAAVWDTVGILAFLTIVTPWVFAVSREIPDFVEYALVTETFKRLTTDELRRTGPIWYFIPILIAGSLPWSLVIAGSMLRQGSTERNWQRVFLLLWIVVPLVFFSLSQSKRPQYVLPLLPAIGLLVAGNWSRAWDRLPGVVAATGGLALLGGMIFTAPFLVPRLLSVSDGVLPHVRSTAVGLGLVTIVAAGASWLSARRPLRLAMALALPTAAVPHVSMGLMGQIGKDRSTASLARSIAQAVPGPMEVVTIRTFPLSLPFYLRRPVLLATEDGAELTSNYLIATFPRWQTEPNSPFRPGDWWFDAMANCDRPRVFVAARRDERVTRILEGRLPQIALTRKHVVYGPCVGNGLALGSPN